MEIVLQNLSNKYLETISFENSENINIHETFEKFSTMKANLKAKIFIINESISSHQLLSFKNHFDKINISSLSIYSNNRGAITAGKSLKIDSKFIKEEEEVKNKLLLLKAKKNDNTLFEGTVRSGERISSNGNLCIIGDVNPGAIVSAKKNIYVWGKLLGIAFAGKSGNHNATISSLFLNPLQLRIADVIAIGPKDKPKNSYPEIAVIANETIIIKPLLVETKK